MAIVATLAVVLAAPALFGERVFASLAVVARAGELWPGLYAPAAARNRVAVDDDGTPLGRVAADAVAQALSGSLVQTLRLRDDPNASDCTNKKYAAYVLVTTSTFALTEGDDLDIGLRLQDCGGWIVGEWHDHQVVTPPPQPGNGARTRSPRCGALAALGAQRTGAQPCALRTRSGRRTGR